MLLCLFFNLFFCQQPQTHVMDKWVDEQVTILKKNEQELDNPAEQSKALFSLVFISHHVTADETTLPSEWGKVTSDGTASLPIHVDTYDLAERMRKVAVKMKWSLVMDETDDGPVMVFGKEKEKHAMIVAEGQYGSWKQLKKEAPLPKGLSLNQWHEVLNARRAELDFRVGQKKPLEGLQLKDCFAPSLARCRILRGDEITANTLFEWLKKWPAEALILEKCLKQARSENSSEIAQKTVEIGKKHPSAIFFIEAAYWYRAQKKNENSIKMLENALKLDPHHRKANQLLKAWQQK